MAVARHGVGTRATLGAVASQVHPVFMLPPVAAAWFGAIIAMEFSLLTGGIHSLAIFAAMYTAHVKDGFIDFHVRGEDTDHPLTVTGCRWCLVGASTLFFACLLALWVTVDWVAVALTLPGWIIGYLHAPQLDMNPIGATIGYPVGIGLAIVGGFYVQTATVSPTALAFALVFIVLLSGVKTIDDAQDLGYDRSIGKPTIAVLVGSDGARVFAGTSMVAALVLVPAFVAVGLFPVGTVIAAIVFAPLAAVGLRSSPTVGTALLIRSCYLFLALLIAAVWFDPL